MIESVKLSSVGNSRIIEMNRPAFLNTLNGEMVEAMTDAIKVGGLISILDFFCSRLRPPRAARSLSLLVHHEMVSLYTALVVM